LPQDVVELMKQPRSAVSLESNESNDFSTGCTNQDTSLSRTRISNARWRLRIVIYLWQSFEMTDTYSDINLFPVKNGVFTNCATESKTVLYL